MNPVPDFGYILEDEPPRTMHSDDSKKPMENLKPTWDN